MKSSKCTEHQTHGCICIWSTAELSKAGIAVASRGAVGMDARTVDITKATWGPETNAAFDRLLAPSKRDAKPAVANDALTDDEKSLIAMAIRSVQRPARRAAANDSPQLVDGYGNAVDYEFLTFDRKAIATKPPVYKPVKALPKVRR